MTELLKRISSYNLFNNLLPGVIFAFIGEAATDWPLVHQNVIATGFLCYFYGLIISRIGSLVIEVILIKINLIKLNYTGFVKASKSDEMISILSETNNTYRSIISLIVILIVLYGARQLIDYCPILQKFLICAIAIGLLFLFIFSYVKQNNYILQRIDVFLSENKED